MSSKLDELPWRVFGRVLGLGCKRATVNVSIMKPRGTRMHGIYSDLSVERVPYPLAPQAAG